VEGVKNEGAGSCHGCWGIDAPGGRRKGTHKYVKHLTSSCCFQGEGAIVRIPNSFDSKVICAPVSQLFSSTRSSQVHLITGDLRQYGHLPDVITSRGRLRGYSSIPITIGFNAQHWTPWSHASTHITNVPS